MIGSTIDGKYRITRELGAGAMGSVYEAEHTATGRRVALKVISSAQLTRDALTVGRFQREARAAGAIDTQHITQVLDAGIDRSENVPFLVMEYLTGEDLSHVIKRLGPIAPDLALRIVAQTCLGLQKAHEANVIHRDIKPANIFLARRDAGEIIVKILDFGIAKVKMDQASDTSESNGLTQTGSMIGSPLYMSPEQARGNKDIDHRADIWSLGVVLYQALSGRTPYQHITALGQLIIAICSEWPPHIQQFAPWVPPEVAAIVHRALRHNPDERYQSASEMFAAIRLLLPNGWSIAQDRIVPLDDTARGQAARRFSLTNELASAATMQPLIHQGAGTTGALTQSQPSIPPPPPAARAPLILSAGALVIATLMGGYALTHRNAPPPAPVTIAPATPQPTLAPTPTPVATPAPVDTSLRRVKVVVIPDDALIDVEGKRVTVKKGDFLEITGTLGSVHRVHLQKGKSESDTDVIITLDGASPPKVELAPAVKPLKIGADAGAPSPANAPTSAPALKPGLATDFDGK